MANTLRAVKRAETHALVAVSAMDQSAAPPQARIPSGEERGAMIAQAAYYLAEHRGFEPGHDLEDWLLAESQIDAAIATGEVSVRAAAP